MHMRALCSFIMLLGRLCLAALFISAGLSKIIQYDQTVQYMASKGMTMVPLFLFGAAAIEIIGGCSLLAGYKTRWGAALLILFLIPVSAIFHDFWFANDAERPLQMVLFMKNVGIFGGLLYVLACGSGGCSCDACLCRHKTTIVEKPVNDRPIS